MLNSSTEVGASPTEMTSYSCWTNVLCSPDLMRACIISFDRSMAEL